MTGRILFRGYGTKLSAFCISMGGGPLPLLGRGSIRPERTSECPNPNPTLRPVGPRLAKGIRQTEGLANPGPWVLSSMGPAGRASGCLDPPLAGGRRDCENQPPNYTYRPRAKCDPSFRSPSWECESSTQELRYSYQAVYPFISEDLFLEILYQVSGSWLGCMKRGWC
jgi:hypothetical protein